MRDCTEIQELLSLYIDDYLEPAEKEIVEKHLEDCPQCQQELLELRQTVQLFAGLNDEELIPPASFRRELREKLEKVNYKEKVGLKDKLKNHLSLVNLKPWMPLAIAAVLLIIIVPVAMLGLGPMGFGEKSDQSMPEMNKSVADSSMHNFSSMEIQENATMDVAAEMAGPLNSIEESDEKTRVSDNGEIERKIIKTGYLSLEVDNYKETAEKINNLVQNMQGYVVNENTYVYDDQRNLLAGNLTVRIPQERFDEALSNLEQMGNAVNRSINSQDVTEEYVDVESRLKAMRLKEDRLLALLEKSGTLGDVLAVENELASTRADIEALIGRLSYLDNRTQLSTINVEMNETLTPVKQIKTTGFQGVMYRFQEALIKSINTIIIGFGNLIVAIGAYLPFIILLLIGIGLLWLVWLKFRKH